LIIDQDFTSHTSCWMPVMHKYDLLASSNIVYYLLHITGGHFVCKLFDIFTRFSVGLVYLMYRAFEHVALFKPVTSRPANSERYTIFLCCCVFVD